MKKFYPLFIVIFLGLIIGNYFFAPKETYLKHDCRLQKSGECVVEDSKYRLSFKIHPLPINPLHDLTYQVSFWDKKKQVSIVPKTVQLRILGHDMTMTEELFFPLEKTSEDNFMAKRLFPTCTEKVMTWRLFLNAKLEDHTTVKTTFDIEVGRLKE